MKTYNNASSGFTNYLNKASKDNIIDKQELSKLEKKAKTDDDKAIVSDLSKDNSKVNFSIETEKGSAKAEYNLSIDLDEDDNIPSPDDKKFQSKSTNYNTLGVGDQSKAQNVTDLSNTNPSWRPVGDLDALAGTFNTPEKVASLMGHIEYDDERGKPLGGDGPLGAQKPEDTLSMYSGVCRDIHQLGAYMLKENGYEAVQMGYVGSRTSHSFLSYREPDGKGYGVVEYGKVYSPEQIKDMLGGRYASSPEEALNALNYGSAAAIYKWTPPAKGEEAYVEAMFYTEKHKNYHQTLKLEHKDSISVSNQLGLQVEKVLSDHFSIKLGVQGDSKGDPTGRGAMHLSGGYKVGNEDNYFKASLGIQHRFFDGSRVVGTTDFLRNPTFLSGARLEGQYRPLKKEYLPGQFTSFTLNGHLAGAFAAVNGEKESDAGKIVTSDKKGYDLDYVSGLPDLKIGMEQKFYGHLTENLTYSTGLFANYDGNLAVAASFMGAPNPLEFTNVGANARLNYDNGKVFSSLHGQYMFHQVNNIDNTSLGLTSGFNINKFSFYTDVQYLDSLEGSRILFEEGAAWNFRPDMSLTASGQQEIVLPNKGDAYTNPGSNKFMLTFKGSIPGT